MIPIVSWTELVPGDTAVASRETGRRADGNVSDFELEVINRLVAFQSPRHLFEIGTFDGRTTLNLAQHSPADAHVFTLDLPPDEIGKTALEIDPNERSFIEKDQSGSRFAGDKLAGKITQLYGDSGNFDFGPFHQNIDFMFVDGSHAYEYVLNDSRIALKMMRPGGLILWHDYVHHGRTAWPGVAKALSELYLSAPEFAGLLHVAGTTLVLLQIGGSAKPLGCGIMKRSPEQIWGTSAQPEFLLADLHVDIGDAERRSNEPITARVVARNIGPTVWLPDNAPTGPVRLACKLLDYAGECINEDFFRNALPNHATIRPGEEVRFETTIPCPSKGHYFFDFDLVAEHVAWFSRNGSKTVTLPIHVDCAQPQGTSAAPSGLKGDLEVVLERPVVQPGTPLRMQFSAINQGPALWLPSGAPVGAVGIGCRLLDYREKGIDLNYWRHPFPAKTPIDPGDGVRFTAEMPCPPPGHYLLEFDLVADGVGWFFRYTGKTVRVPLHVGRSAILATTLVPENLVGVLEVDFEDTAAAAGSPFQVRFKATNTGRAHWLPAGAPLGAVRLGCRLLDPQGHCLDTNYWHLFFRRTEPVEPGESVFVAAEVPSPSIPGQYCLEFDLVADGVSWFFRNGPTLVQRAVYVGNADTRGTSVRAGCLRADLSVRLKHQAVPLGTALDARFDIINSGGAVWLPAGAGIGSVRLGCRLLSYEGKCLDENFWHGRLSSTMAVYPGDRVDVECEVRCPPRGHFILEFDLVAEGVSWFFGNGSPTARVPVHIGTPEILGASSRPEHLSAELLVTLERSELCAGELLLARFNIVNSGQALWLSHPSPLGAVRLGCRLWDTAGKCIDENFWALYFPRTEPIAPGEQVEVESILRCPPQGDYLLEFDLVADGVTWFGVVGSKTAVLPLRVI